jgi:hypothetical protein
MLEGNAILYSDAVHLSKAGSDRAIRHFAPELTRLLFLPPAAIPAPAP